MSKYIVCDPMIVNGVPRERGDVLEGADAAAVEESPLLRHRVTQHTTAEPDPVPVFRTTVKTGGDE